MARIPDATSLLGREGSLHTTSVPQTGVDTGVEAAFKKLGSGVSDIGVAIKKEREETETQQNTLDLTKARAHWNAGITQLDSKYRHENDADYATWGKRYQEDVTKLRAEAVGMVSDENKRTLLDEQFSGQARQYQVGVEDRSKGIARDLGRTQFSTALDQNVTTAASSNGDAKKNDGILAESKAAIDSAVRTGLLTPAEGEAKWQRVRTAILAQEAQQRHAADPEAMRGAFGMGGVAPKAQGEGKLNIVYRGALDSSDPGKASPKSMYQHLISRGATPNEALVLTGAAASESGFNDAVSHDGGIGYGLFGHNGGRLAAMRREAGTDRPTWQQQADFALKELRSRPEGARVNSAQSAEELANVQMAFERPRGYTDATPEAGHNYSGRLNTIRRFSVLSGQSFSEPVSQRYASLDTRTRESLVAQAERENRQEQISLKGRIEDDLASLKTTGIGVDGLDRSQVERFLGSAKAVEWERGRNNAKLFHETTKDFDTLPNNQIIGRIESARPAAGKDGFAEAQQTHEEIAKKGSEIIKRRQQDPASASDEIDMVRKARESAEYDGEGTSRRIKPESAQAIIRARLAAQDMLGIDRQHAVTRGEARVISRQLRAIGEDDANGLNTFMKSLRQTYGAYADTVLASSLELEGVNRDLSNAATKILSQISAGMKPDIASVRAAEANLSWGREGEGSALAQQGNAGAQQQAQPQQQAPAGATFEARDLQWLWQNRQDPNAATEFDAKYGGGNAARVLQDLERRFGTKGKK